MVNIYFMFNGHRSASKHLSLEDLPDNDVTADNAWDRPVSTTKYVVTWS